MEIDLRICRKVADIFAMLWLLIGLAALAMLIATCWLEASAGRVGTRHSAYLRIGNGTMTVYHQPSDPGESPRWFGGVFRSPDGPSPRVANAHETRVSGRILSLTGSATCRTILPNRRNAALGGGLDEYDVIPAKESPLMEDDHLSYYRAADVKGERLGPRVALGPEGADLLTRIKHAFADWPPNAGLTWVQGEMLDNYESDEMVREGACIGAHERWQDVPPELLAAFPSAVWFLDDAGLNFYWPALMAWELQFGPTYGWASPAEKLPEWSERLRPQTEEQFQVFTAYKQYISSRR